MLFNRQASISVGKGGQMGSKLTGLRMTFNVVKTEDAEPNDVRASLYNLSPNTRSAFETAGNRIVIEAGYPESLALLAVGDIVTGETSYDHPDIVTSVEAKDGGIGLRNARASVTYKAGTPARTMVEELMSGLDVDNIEITADLSGAFRSAWSTYGNVRDSLDKLAARFGFTWSVQNNTAQITPARQPSQRSAVVLTPQSGLIGIPSKLDTTGGNQDGAKDAPGVSVTCLLNPALLPGDPIVIESAAFPRATYRIRRVEHYGDTHGRNWYSDVEAVTQG